MSKKVFGVKYLCVLGSFALLMTALIFPQKVVAQDQIKPRILLIVDTSGSMLFYVDSGGNTSGDGSWDPWDTRSCCPGGGNSRMYVAKEAMRQMIFATGDIDFALMKFAQRYMPWGDERSDYFRKAWYVGNQVSGSNDYLRYEDSGCTPADDGYGRVYLPFAEYDPDVPSSAHEWLCVEFPSEPMPDNRGPLMMWMDHHEFLDDGSREPDLVPEGWSRAEAGLGFGYEQELRASQGTPLADSMLAAKGYLEHVFQNDWDSNSMTAQCRPYAVILLTDGEDTCGEIISTDPLVFGPADTNAASQSLHTIEYVYDSEEPPAVKNIDIWPIGFAFSGNMAVLNQIAVNGGTGPNAKTATSQAELSGVLYEIISSSLLVEVCNGMDDNCNGLTDEGFTLYCNTWTDGADNTGSCAVRNDEQNMCDRPSECACDGVDNNCDGQTDEIPDGLDSWPSLGACGGCDSSVPGQEYCVDPSEGRCKQGSMLCFPGQGYQCAGSIEPSTEICNGLDDDCDGLTDEGITGDSCGPCGDGNMYCVSGQMQCCLSFDGTTCTSVTSPSAEVCDNVDNNCNGQTDEGVPPRTCYDPAYADNMGVGICTPGFQTCQAGLWGSENGGVWEEDYCADQQLPLSSDPCNGQDDDCDGETDEDFAGSSCGACGDGQEYCLNGFVVCCSGLDGNICLPIRVPVAEDCNGIDDDCDGETDENLPPQACMDCTYFDYDEDIYNDCLDGMLYGICAEGFQECEVTGWGACQNMRLPTTELCNKLDDDCDGATDEGLGGVACGLCGDGQTQCVGGLMQCVGASPPTQEVCDGADNNCNGFTDENILRACGGCVAPLEGDPEPEYEDCLAAQAEPESEIGPEEGACSQGRELCTGEPGGVWGECENSIGPVFEICNGIDDDCDGETDEGTGGSPCGLCQDGSTQCIGGMIQCIGATPPVPEICDGVDNNCNGQTDENLFEECGGCVAPVAEDDDAGEPEPDPAYEDCLAAQDNNEEIGPDEGACRTGRTWCSGGVWGSCEDSTGPSAEICNGIDDDCDGNTDEGLGGDTCGLCGDGTTQCISGIMQCVGASAPGAETCDGIDNNCNGSTDENIFRLCGGCVAPSEGEPGPEYTDCLAAQAEPGSEIGPEEGACRCATENMGNTLSGDMGDTLSPEKV